MASSIFETLIERRIANLPLKDNSIVVLKGIPLEAVGENPNQQLTFEDICSNKLKHLLKMVESSTKFITYEDFLLLSDLILSQYSEVYILNNNIYMTQYPISLNCSDETRQGLLAHFLDPDDAEDDDVAIEKNTDISSLFIGLKEFNGYYLGVYNDQAISGNEKIVNINLFEPQNEVIKKQSRDAGYIDLIEESDYIGLIRTVFEEPDEIYIRTLNYTGDKKRLMSHLQMLAYYWSEWTDIYIVQAEAMGPDYKSRPDYKAILEQYWGHSSFRDIQIYNLAKLEEGQKEIETISQERIISNLVDQAELCFEGKEGARDLFVTAPTGAGKSAMFQIPAIYLAEKYNLLTIVISPLIGLMNDQVKGLEVKDYRAAKTINSDISPIVKQDVVEKVAEGQYHILYISPETLLSRSDVEQLIGNRTIGMIIVDEAHIVTTWGKQFRPDYLYLGDHIRKLRKNQMEKQGKRFVVATFTATAIYRGFEDMYQETCDSLHMIDPITYLGYVKRDDITISIKKKEVKKNQRSEYEYDKFDDLEKLIKRAKITKKKTLVYFPTVALINRCYEYLRARQMTGQVAIYHGSLNKESKMENYEKFLSGDKTVMLATKAFGMGIDIDDIAIVAHFAPTGNVCDYVQEIGRAARNPSLNGEAFYLYDPKDFKHINRLHGLSMIKKYQLIEVIRKIDELYRNSMNSGGRNNYTRRRNAMLLDAENFSYVFGSPVSDEDDNINKVKTALLIIQKSFENTIGFSPINVRPIPLFSQGFFEIPVTSQRALLRKYPHSFEVINSEKNICRVNLDNIWKKSYGNYSFPKFKYLLYSKDPEFDFARQYPMNSALCVSLDFCDDYDSIFDNMWNGIKGFINEKVVSNKHIAMSEIIDAIALKCEVSKYKAQAISEVLLATMDSYRRDFNPGTTPIAKENVTNSGDVRYQFNSAVNGYFNWVKKIYKYIVEEVDNGELYLVNNGRARIKEVSVVLGLLESLDVLSFKMLGGANSQLYIYINQIQSLRNIIENPGRYHNDLLQKVSDRHLVSVKMLTYLYETEFSSDEKWNILEDYFLGIIPDKVKRDCLIENPRIMFDD